MGALTGLRVVELGGGMAAPMAAGILADAGAVVMKVEPSEGDHARDLPGFFLWNRGKRSVVLDLDTSADREAAASLIADADVVIESIGQTLAERYALDPDSMFKYNSGLIYCSIDNFGPYGPLSHVRAYEGTINAALGRVNGRDAVTGRAAGTPPDRPVNVAAPMLGYAAAHLAAQGILSCLYSGIRPQHVKTSLLQGAIAVLMRESLAMHTEETEQAHQDNGAEIVHYALQHICFKTVECADGNWIQMCARQVQHFRAWMKGIGLGDVLDVPEFSGAPMRFSTKEDVDRLSELICTAMRSRTRDEWMSMFIDELDVGADPFLTPEEFMEHPQMTLNGRTVLTQQSDGRAVYMPGSFVNMTKTPCQVDRRTPDLGEDACRFPSSTVPRWHHLGNSHDRERWKPPLDGVTVVECAYFLAGPLGATLLAELGARVIKLEPLEGDPWRRTAMQAVRLLQGKESVAVDLKSQEGRRIAQDLVERAHVFLHNFRPGVPDRLGIDYSTLTKVNPTLVYVYAASYGSMGPQSHRAAFHSTAAALSGFGIAQAGQGNGPVDESSPDPVAGIGVATAALLALIAQRRYQLGQYVETTMLASTAMLLSNELVLYEGRPPHQLNDSRQLGTDAFHRLYRCDDGWIYVELGSDDERRRFAEAMGYGTDLTDPSTDVAGYLEADLARRSKSDVLDRIRDADVAVVAVYDGTFEAFLVDQGLVDAASHPEFGAYWKPYGRYDMPGIELRRGGPCSIGEHTTSILLELGLSPARVHELLAADRVGQADRPGGPDADAG